MQDNSADEGAGHPPVVHVSARVDLSERVLLRLFAFLAAGVFAVAGSAQEVLRFLH